MRRFSKQTQKYLENVQLLATSGRQNSAMQWAATLHKSYVSLLNYKYTVSQLKRGKNSNLYKYNVTQQKHTSI